jgi:hypothetical protein
LLPFRASVGGHLDAGIAALPEISGGHQRIGSLLNRGLVRASKSHSFGVLVHSHSDTLDVGHGFFHAFDATLAAEVNVADLRGNLGGPRRKSEGQCNDNGGKSVFHEFNFNVCK